MLVTFAFAPITMFFILAIELVVFVCLLVIIEAIVNGLILICILFGVRLTFDWGGSLVDLMIMALFLIAFVLIVLSRLRIHVVMCLLDPSLLLACFL
jgi:hypothetical protein